jgi:hypothetical protein
MLPGPPVGAEPISSIRFGLFPDRHTRPFREVLEDFNEGGEAAPRLIVSGYGDTPSLCTAGSRDNRYALTRVTES